MTVVLGAGAAYGAEFDLIIDNLDSGFNSRIECTRGVPILMYHGLDGPHGHDPEDFRTQMRWLADNGYQCLSLDDLKDWIKTGEPEPPSKSVILTFDDVYITVYSVAYPMFQTLRDEGRTFFGYNYAHSLYVGVPPGGPPPTSFDHADYPECAEMEADGLMFTESHTVTHSNLTALSFEQEWNEISQSKSDIEQGMGKTVRHFSYPFGEYNAETVELLELAGYETAVSTIEGLNTRDTPLLELRRYNVTPSMALGSSFTRIFDAVPGTEWGVSVGAPGWFGENYALAVAGNGCSTAEWTFTVPTDGTYEVSAWWAAHPNRASNAPFKVSHSGGTTTLPMNQRSNGSQWNALGTWSFPAETTWSVSLSNLADGFVIADAIRIRQVSSPTDIWVIR